MSFANEKANHAIECHVTQCNNHCGCADYCSLDKVCIGTHECDPTVDQCTDCLLRQEVNFPHPAPRQPPRRGDLCSVIRCLRSRNSLPVPLSQIPRRLLKNGR